MSTAKKSPYEEGSPEYKEGYASGRRTIGKENEKCPYDEGTWEYEAWWYGFGQVADDYDADDQDAENQGF